ncbi:hypothetical protein DNTS_034771, partial [Danionella cerebrum]
MEMMPADSIFEDCIEQMLRILKLSINQTESFIKGFVEPTRKVNNRADVSKKTLKVNALDLRDMWKLQMRMRLIFS